MNKLFLILSAAIVIAAPTLAEARQHHRRVLTDHERVAILRWRVGKLDETLKALQTPKQITHAVNASKHAWPDLTDDEKAALAEVLKTVPKTVKFDIICNDAGCNDLAMDIDDAMEKAGLDSFLDRSLGPLGYGIDIQVNTFDMKAAQQAGLALKKATSGRLDLAVIEAPPSTNPPGYVTIRIGKYRAPANPN